MKNQSDISPESYKYFVQNAAITIPKNKALFWSRTKEDAFQFANVAGYVTLEKTLIGLLGDGLVWCGENDNSELAEECLDPFTNGTATGSFWNKMSETFARTASGEVQVLLNGSTGLAFNSSSTFGSVEVYSLDPNKVSTMNIWILYYFNGSDWVIKESCKGHSIEKLKDILTAKNITSSCTENNRKLIHIQCARFSNESIYELCLSGVSNIDMTFSTTTLLAIIIAIHKWFEELVLHS
ncbi:ADP-ribosyl cyclase/cyclic ADP-ribose hydrolase 1-like [Protopterus annectens]|uniref:ADP-ribosyl cyclase/cyclic ADP-ribose hydrolase 1-like n=1 Tax=Protopterus annectens TaxID=7888 RepID=UPI001CFB9B20|nr:ADP-ribosyl cyclase/cyclic ADP-ribose hydrolase 1-like [Protopterus annectens]